MRKPRPTHPSWPCAARFERPTSCARTSFPTPAPIPRPLRGGTTTSFQRFKDRPSAGSLLGSPLPPVTLRPASGTTAPPLLHVPPPWFSTTSTVSSSRTLHGCCTVLPTLGFAGFRLLPEVLPDARSALRSLPSARSRRPSPSRSRVRFTGRSCPLGLARFADHPPPPLFPTTEAMTHFARGPSGPCSTNGSVADVAVADFACPVLPWACLIHHPFAPATSEPARGTKRDQGNVKDLLDLRWPAPPCEGPTSRRRASATYR